MNLQFMIRDEKYLCMKTDGIIARDIDSGIRRYMKYFGNEISYEQLMKNYEKININKLFSEVCSQFEKRQGMNVSRVELINRYKEGIAVVSHPSKIFPAVYVDELFESTIIDFLLTSFLWSEFYEEPEIWEFSFVNMLRLFQEQCIFGRVMSEDSVGGLFEWIAQKDVRLLDWAADCYWSILAFSLAHELYHICYNKVPKKDATDSWYRREEFKADRVAYDVVLHMIMEDVGKKGEEKLLYEHSCMAPMMLMDFFDLYYYTDRVIYRQWVDDKRHPKPKKRKEQLFGILYKPEYEFDTEKGYILYNAILDVIHNAYKENVLLKESKGKLNAIKDYDIREALFQNSKKKEGKEDGD